MSPRENNLPLILKDLSGIARFVARAVSLPCLVFLTTLAGLFRTYNPEEGRGRTKPITKAQAMDELVTVVIPAFFHLPKSIQELEALTLHLLKRTEMIARWKGWKVREFLIKDIEEKPAFISCSRRGGQCTWYSAHL